MRTEKKIDQKFAVISYAVAICVSTLLAVIVQTALPQGTNEYLYFSYLLPQVGYIGVFAVMWKLYGKPFKGLLRREDVHGLDYALAAVIAVAMLFFAVLPNNGVQKLFELMGIKATVIVPKMEAWHEYLLCGLLICVLPAIGEELIFRKAFCDGMSEVADYRTILLAGLCFSLSHLNPAQTVHQFFLGCVLALVYVKTKNITVTIMMHCINNLLALYLEGITGAAFWNNITVGGISLAAGAVVLAAGLILFLRQGNKLNNKKRGKVGAYIIGLIVVLGVAWIVMLVASFL